MASSNQSIMKDHFPPPRPVPPTLGPQQNIRYMNPPSDDVLVEALEQENQKRNNDMKAHHDRIDELIQQDEDDQLLDELLNDLADLPEDLNPDNFADQWDEKLDQIENEEREEELHRQIQENPMDLQVPQWIGADFQVPNSMPRFRIAKPQAPEAPVFADQLVRELEQIDEDTDKVAYQEETHQENPIDLQVAEVTDKDAYQQVQENPMNLQVPQYINKWGCAVFRGPMQQQQREVQIPQLQKPRIHDLPVRSVNSQHVQLPLHQQEAPVQMAPQYAPAPQLQLQAPAPQPKKPRIQNLPVRPANSQHVQPQNYQFYHKQAENVQPQFLYPVKVVPRPEVVVQRPVPAPAQLQNFKMAPPLLPAPPLHNLGKFLLPVRPVTGFQRPPQQVNVPVETRAPMLPLRAQRPAPYQIPRKRVLNAPSPQLKNLRPTWLQTPHNQPSTSDVQVIDDDIQWI